ncbi:MULTISPECIES: hypothetical protein [Allobacillus]|uniref:Uncharacterized protein n=1 Tax=Allobacillus salarius TaxID=1955272 RepID=A0A556PPE1_9BACI|nr:hypothetical protein [Allobacillus salarius]TSJ66253.1 hypothetical protein FPQ13_05145 [Allobacillus salarius]
MRIIVSTFLLGLVAAFCLTLPVLASDSSVDVSDEITNKYEYNYNGIDITTDVEKTEDELKRIYQSVIEQTNIQNGEFSISPLRDDPGNTTVIETPPNYRTYTNKTLNLTIDATIGYFLKYIPTKVTDKFFFNFVGASLTDFASVDETYVGSWISSHWSSYHQQRRYEATLIYYHDDNYSRIKSIEVHDVTHLY